MGKEGGGWVEGGHTAIPCKTAKQQSALECFGKAYDLALAVFLSLCLCKLQEN